MYTVPGNELSVLSHRPEELPARAEGEAVHVPAVQVNLPHAQEWYLSQRRQAREYPDKGQSVPLVLRAYSGLVLLYVCVHVFHVQENALKLADFGSCKSVYSKQPYTEYISTRW